MKNRPIIALALLLLAVLLPFGLLHYSEYTRFYPQDDGKPAPRPIFLLQRDVYTNEFLQECGGKVTACAMITVQGLFGRSFVSPGIALIAGLVLPQLLLLGCAAYTFDRRWVFILALCLGALLLVYNLIHYASSYIEPVESHATTAAQLPLVETYREPQCNMGNLPACNEPHGELRTGYFLDERLPPLVALLLGLVLPAILALAALGMGFVSAWRGVAVRRWSLA